MGSRTQGMRPPMQQRSDFPQPQNMLGAPRIDRAQMAQQRRNRSMQPQAPQNLYGGQGAEHISAVMGGDIGLGNNNGYVLHKMDNGQFGYNQGNLDPVMRYLTGDYSKWFK